MAEVASPHKILLHREKVRDYLNGKPIFPVTLELDITSDCSKKCTDCPSARSSESWNLNPEFIDRLFASLEGQTHGLLLTGGEPTMSPLFPEVLKMARSRGFLDVAVVTNGGFLDDVKVMDALVAHASTIRLSLYDWDSENCSGLKSALHRISTLRQRIDHANSSLKIGVSALTSSGNIGSFAKAAESVRTAGAHWIYFHPSCIRWSEGSPRQVNQDGVIEEVQQYRQSIGDDFQACFFRERYLDEPIEFGAYHAADFLMVLGADGKNYLGPEVKYQPKHVVADFSEGISNGFLWHPDRLERIAAANSRTYPALKSRHRGVLYNHVIERLLSEKDSLDSIPEPKTSEDFWFPNIL
jgi:organic radical activating enzyme